MDEPRPIRKRLTGTESLANPFLPKARALLQTLKRRLGNVKVGVARMTTPDGVEITAKTYGVGPDIIEINILGATFCVLIGELTGFICLPSATIFTPYYSFAGVGTTRPEVVLQPSKNKDSGVVSYQSYLYRKQFPTDALAAFKGKAKPYSTQSDTCGNSVLPWYKDRLLYGNIDWRGPKGITLTWFGSPCRYIDGVDSLYVDRSTLPFSTPGISDGASWPNSIQGNGAYNYSNFYSQLRYGGLYYRGKAVTLNFPTGYPVSGEKTSGAAITTDISGQKYLILVTAVHPFADPTHRAAINTERVWSAPIKMTPTSITLSAPLSLLQTLTWDDLGAPWHSFNLTPWLFNESGTQAVCNRFYNGSGATGLFRYFLNVSPLSATAVKSVATFTYSTDYTAPSITDVSSSITYDNGGGPQVLPYRSAYSCHPPTTHNVVSAKYGDYVGDVFTELVVSIVGSLNDSVDFNKTAALVSTGPSTNYPSFTANATQTIVTTQGASVTVDGVPIFSPDPFKSTEAIAYVDSYFYAGSGSTAGFSDATTYTGNALVGWLALDARNKLAVAELSGGRVLACIAGVTVYDSGPGTADNSTLSKIGQSTDMVTSGTRNGFINAVPGADPAVIGDVFTGSPTDQSGQQYGSGYLTSSVRRFVAGAHYGSACTKDAVFLALPTLVVSLSPFNNPLSNQYQVLYKYVSNGEPRIRYITSSDPRVETGQPATTPGYFAPLGVL